MSPERTIQTRNQALIALAECAECIRGRNPLIRQADALGISKAEIARILGMSRQHVTEIANSPAAGASPARRQGRTPKG